MRGVRVFLARAFGDDGRRRADDGVKSTVGRRAGRRWTRASRAVLRGMRPRSRVIGRTFRANVSRVGTAANAVALGASFVNATGSRRARRRRRGEFLNDPDRACTDGIIVATCGAFALQLLTRQTLTGFGVKINEKIAAGELWRLVTPMFLHGGLPHLMVNMYSLNSIGPLVEATFGREQFCATYLAAGLAGNYASYRFCPTPSLGASGAVFGLAGALAVYLQRHKHLLGERADMQLKQIGSALAVNMAFGLTSARIDNWGHGGGLLGGAASAYFTGPNLVLESDDPSGRSMRRKIVNKPVVQSFVKAVQDFWDEDDEEDE